MDRGTWQATVHSLAELDTTEQLNTTYIHICYKVTTNTKLANPESLLPEEIKGQVCVSL